MQKDFKFSIITAFYNTEIYIGESIDSLINQTLNFEDNVQLILVDDGSTDESRSIALSYQKQFPDNIIVLSQENKGVSAARNLGLKHANGRYVNFLDSDDMLSSNTLENVLKYFKNDINIVSIPIEYIGEDEEHNLMPKFEKSRIVNVFKDIEYPQTNISSCFIKKDIMNDNFDENLRVNEDFLLMNKLLINEKKYGLLNDCTYYYRIRPDETAISDLIILEKDFFTKKVELSYKQLMDYAIDKLGYVPDFIQYVIALDIENYFKVPTSEVLSKVEYNQFRKSLRDVLNQIDNEFILNNEYIVDTLKSLLIYLKNDEFHIEVESNKVFLKSDDYVIDELHNHLLVFDIVEIIEDSLNFSTFFNTTCDYDYFRMEAIKVTPDGKKEVYEGKFFSYPTTNRYPVETIGLCWHYKYSVDFKIPIMDGERFKVYFNLIYDEDGKHAEMHNPIQFQNYDAGLSKVSNYLIKDNKMVIYDSSDESFSIQPYSFGKCAKLEAVSILKTIKDHNTSTLSAIFYHLMYLFLYPFMRNRRIWLFQDRVDIADDNAKHLFRYAVNQDDDIEKYFVISRNCEDYGEMKKINKNIVALGSFKNKFLYLFAEKMISSHVNHSWLNPFFNPSFPYYNGLLSIEKCFLQHGVIKDDLSSWLRKCFQNLHLFLTSSDYERDSILGETYNYDEEVVQAFGLPRHDNLKFGVAKKEILFSPTWRKHLINRQSFEKSEYYHRLNSFLNNERLLKEAKKKGYKIVFKPHYDLLPFLDLFTLQEGVEVNTHDSYQTIFNNSAVMITDYSSVFFDFSFLKKPVIYYHEGDDYHYDKGYFDYETMGFGDVVESEDALVDKVIYYMNHDCIMEDKYKQRVDKFFKYTDQKNSKRVYDWLYKH